MSRPGEYTDDVSQAACPHRHGRDLGRSYAGFARKAFAAGAACSSPAARMLAAYKYHRIQRPWLPAFAGVTAFCR